TVGEPNREKCGNPCCDDENQKRVQAGSASPVAKAHRAQKVQQHMGPVHGKIYGASKLA
ncbi:MAG: hypothetical protein RIS92_1202, partial [Verrucomicrobiota bacterium]